MSLLNKLMDKIGLGVLHYFLYNDHEVGIVTSRWRRIIIVATDQFDTLFLRISEFKRASCGEKFPEMGLYYKFDKAFSGVDDPNKLEVGKIGRCIARSSSTYTYLVKVIDIDGSVVCLKIPYFIIVRAREAATTDLELVADKLGIDGRKDTSPESFLCGPTVDGELISFPKMDVIELGEIKKQLNGKKPKPASELEIKLVKMKEVPKEEPIKETSDTKELSWFGKLLKFIFG